MFIFQAKDKEAAKPAGPMHFTAYSEPVALTKDGQIITDLDDSVFQTVSFLYVLKYIIVLTSMMKKLCQNPDLYSDS